MNFKAKKLTALLLALLLFSSVALSSCSFFSSYDGHTVFNFAGIRYEAPDTAELDETFRYAEKISNKCKNLSPADINSGTGLNNYRVLIDSLNEMSAVFGDFVTKFVYIRIAYLQDMSKQDIQAEYDRLYSLYNSYYNKYISILSIIAESPLGEVAMSEGTRITILNRSKYSSNSEFVRLQDEIDAIGHEYEDAYGALETVDAAQELEIAELFIRLAKKGNELAAVTDYDTYAAYQYEVEHERDYLPSEVAAFCDYVKEYLVPVVPYTDLSSVELTALGILNNTLNTGAPAYEVMDSYISAYAEEISPTMKRAFDYLKVCNLFVAGNLSTSYDGGFTTMLSTYNAPVIYLKTKKNYSDLPRFIHEFGHFHAYYVDSPNSNALDVAETQSQGNEYLFLDTYTKIGGISLKHAMLKANLKSNLIYAILMGCIMDSLQQYVYDNADEITPERVCQRYRELLNDYGLSEIIRGSFWANIQHTFVSPFYYISYAVSQIPALELFALSETNKRTEAIGAYNNVLTSSANGFKEVMKESGLGNPFERTTCEKIKSALMSALAA